MIECQAMGNFCSQDKGLPTNRPPRDLKSLLDDLGCSSLQPSPVIEASPWARAFRMHLKRKDSPDQEAMLDFLVGAETLRRKTSDLAKLDPAEAQAEQLQRDRRALVLAMGADFFSPDSARPVALSSRVMRDELTDAVVAVAEDHTLSNALLEEACDLVSTARSDPAVWKAGLDRAYNAFLATRPSLPVNAAFSAVLMSLM